MKVLAHLAAAWRTVRASREDVLPAPGPAAVPEPAAPTPVLATRVRELELELQDREEIVRAMRTEYAALEAARARAAAEGGTTEREKLFRALAGPLATAAALAGLVRCGREVALEDLVAAVETLGTELERAGLQRIGTVGEEVPFDAGRQQRTGSARPGEVVRIRIPGYRMGERVLLKAVVG